MDAVPPDALPLKADAEKRHPRWAKTTQLSLRGDCPSIESNSPKIINPVMIAPISIMTPTSSYRPL